MLPPLSIEHTIERTVREEWGRILSALTGSLNNLQLAEDCLQEAVLSAMTHWAKNGLPNAPAAWLITVARRKALDRLRRDRNFAAKQDEIAYLMELDSADMANPDDHAIPDKRLEMIFTCCYPTLEGKSQIALTLRTLGGLSTEDIAKAFLDKPDAMQQRITRAKKKIANAGIPYKIPETDDLPDRTTAVLGVLYLIFNEGYAARKSDTLTRVELSAEAIRLARIVSSLLPDHAEAGGLLALMLLHDSRRLARCDDNGDMIALEHQNRDRWNGAQIAEGIAILERILPRGQIGPYQLQAAISAVHAKAASWDQTDWSEIAQLYDLLAQLQPSPVIRINQAMAISYAQGLDAAFALLDRLNDTPKIQSYQPYHAAYGDLYARAGKLEAAKHSFQTAISLTDNLQEKRFLQTRRDQLIVH